jgi:hypothetical protein
VGPRAINLNGLASSQVMIIFSGTEPSPKRILVIERRRGRPQLMRTRSSKPTTKYAVPLRFCIEFSTLTARPNWKLSSDDEKKN